VEGRTLSTGYTSYISLKGSQEPVKVSPHPIMGEVYGYRVMASVWPSSGVYKKSWTPLAVSCNGQIGGVLVVADSSILINKALNTSLLYANTSIDMIKNVAGNESMLIIVDESLYAETSASLILRLHPSFLILKVGRMYAQVESKLVELLDNRGLGWLFTLLFATIILLSTWASSRSSSGLGKRKKIKKEEVNLEKISANWNCRSIMEDIRANNIGNLINGIADELMREEARKLYKEIIDGCSDNLINVLLSMLSTKHVRSVAEKYKLLKSILGLETTIEIGKD
jgi:hypothetical protein